MSATVGFPTRNQAMRVLVPKVYELRNTKNEMMP